MHFWPLERSDDDPVVSECIDDERFHPWHPLCAGLVPALLQMVRLIVCIAPSLASVWSLHDRKAY